MDDVDYDDYDADSDNEKHSSKGDSNRNSDGGDNDPHDVSGNDTPPPDIRRRYQQRRYNRRQWESIFSNDRYTYTEAKTDPQYEPGTDGNVFFQMADVIKDTFLAHKSLNISRNKPPLTRGKSYLEYHSHSIA